MYFEYGENEILYLKSKDRKLAEVTAETILSVDISKLQSYGMTFRKAEYITDFSEKVHSDAFNLDAVWQMTDEEAIRELSSLKAIKSQFAQKSVPIQTKTVHRHHRIQMHFLRFKYGIYMQI